MRDCIEIRDLLVRTFVGVNDWEQRQRQDALVSMWIHADTREAGRNDDLSKTLNYRTVAKRVLEVTEAERYLLVERMAEEVARILVREFGARRVRVRVEKPAALRHARTVSVAIEREAEDFPG